MHAEIIDEYAKKCLKSEQYSKLKARIGIHPNKISKHFYLGLHHKV